MSSEVVIKEFCKELSKLMRKYRITCIGGEFDGDTHGIYNERFVVVDDDNKYWVVSEDYGTHAYQRDLQRFSK